MVMDVGKTRSGLLKITPASRGGGGGRKSWREAYRQLKFGGKVRPYSPGHLLVFSRMVRMSFHAGSVRNPSDWMLDIHYH